MVPDKKSEEFMKTLFIVTLIVLAVLIVLSIVLAIIGKKAKKKSDDQREAMMAQSQVMSFYIIDKKKMKLSEANMPKVVTDNLPKMVKRAKMPVLKVKVGPKVMSLIADEEVFKSVLPKQEVKADEDVRQHSTDSGSGHGSRPSARRARCASSPAFRV